MSEQTLFYCPRCKSTELFMMVSVTLVAPLAYQGNLSKQRLRDKDVELWGALWPLGIFYCQDCGHELWHPHEKHGTLIYGNALRRIQNVHTIEEAKQLATQAINEVDEAALLKIIEHFQEK